MKTYNVSPYFDDFDESKDFHQIMFKPGYAVQARELTQLQTILRDQIEKFGNHVFKHGSVVIPGNSISDLAVPYVKINSQFNNTNIILSRFENQVIVGVTTGVKAIVKKTIAADLTDPILFYLSYISGGSTESNGITTNHITFLSGEELYVESNTGIRATVSSSNSIGVGSLAYVNKGVYYINGSFVEVAAQSVILDKFSSFPSCHVLLKINETLVDAIEDTSLLDNSQGSYNYAAPGADRVKISLELTTLPLGSQITSDYVEIMRYNNGVLEEHARYSKYSELEKSLARRTYDESGNYIVNGFLPTIKEHLKEYNNGGVYSSPTGNIDKMIIDVSPGKGYIDGFEVEKLTNARFVIDKARTQSHIKDITVNLRPEFGQYIIISDVNGGVNGFLKTVVNLYNDNDETNGSATLIGTAKIIGIDYLDAGESQPNMYKLWVSDISIGENSLELVGGIRGSNGLYAYVLSEYTIPVRSGGFQSGETITHSSGRVATVKYFNAVTSKVYAYKNSHTQLSPKIGDTVVGSASSTSATITDKKSIITSGQTGMVFKLPKTVPATIKDPETNAYNLRYTVQTQLTMTIVGGSGSVSISSGSFDAIETGTFVAIGPSGVISNNVFQISGNSIIASGSPQNGKVIIYANVTKEDVFPRTKTIQTFTETITTTSSNITLSKTDVTSITSVINNSNDITNNYTLFNGQTDYEYGYGKLLLKSGKTKHTGNTVTVTYTYYAHSGSGDFFCIDSYSSVSNFLDKNVSYRSQTTGITYDLSACLDFRPSVTASSYNLLVSDTPFISTLQYYVPRIDSLTIDSAGKLNIIAGIPNESPKSPSIPAGQFEVNRFYIPEYTRSIKSVRSVRLDVERFTMSDIKAIVNRVSRVEDFATLSASESLLANMNVVDGETGLDRFKTGFFVENFKQPLTIANTTSVDFKTTFVNSTLAAPQEKINCHLSLMDDSSNYVLRSGYLMLPYTEEVFAAQPLSSRTTNLNPFLITKWDGVLDVSPSSDSWVDMQDLPTVYDATTETVEVIKYIDPPPCPVYTIVPDYVSLSEGQTVTFTVSTKHTDVSTLYWTIKQDVNTSDFTDTSLSGTVQIINETGTFSKTIVADSITEGTERFYVQLRLESTSGKVVATTPEISILDSSVYTAPVPTPISAPVPSGGSTTTYYEEDSSGGGVWQLVADRNANDGSTVWVMASDLVNYYDLRTTDSRQAQEFIQSQVLDTVNVSKGDIASGTYQGSALYNDLYGYATDKGALSDKYGQWTPEQP